jgi:CheY-like chemotaxis protein
MRLTAEMILKDLGYSVTLAENGKKGLKIFKEAPDRYDLILLDMIMPEMNGSDCFYEIKKVRPDMKVILSSGFTREEDLIEMKAKGLTAFISKPFRSTEISQALHNALCSGR